MKIILLLLFPIVTSAQKYALIDKDFKKPILFTDSITINQVSSNYFPVQVKALDSLVANLEFVKTGLKASIQRSKFKSYRLASSNSSIKVESVNHAYGDSYSIVMTTATREVHADFLIADHSLLVKKASKNIDKLITYIKADKSITINVYKEYKATLLDATVYIK